MLLRRHATGHVIIQLKGSAPATGAVVGASPTTLASVGSVRRLVTRHAVVPTGEGAGRQRPRRARSPVSTARRRL